MTDTNTQNTVSLGVCQMPDVQPEAILALQKEMGVKSSQEVIERAAFELSDRLWLLEQAFNAKDMPNVRSIALSLIATSRQMGLIEFSNVAQTLADCISCADSTATHAVAARLIRVGEMSLYYVVQFPERSG